MRQASSPLSKAAQAPVFVPMAATAAPPSTPSLSAASKDFVPRAQQQQDDGDAGNTYNPAAPAFEPQPATQQQQQGYPPPPPVYYGAQNTYDEQQLSDQFQHGMNIAGPSTNPYAHAHAAHPHSVHHAHPHAQAHTHVSPNQAYGYGGEEFYGRPAPMGIGVINPHSTTTPFIGQPLQYHLYAQPLPHVAGLSPQQLATNSFFMSQSLREDLQRRSEAIAKGLGPGESEKVSGYWGLYPIDQDRNDPKNEGPATGFFGYSSCTYKAGSEQDGRCYALRRICGFRLPHENALGVVERWTRLRHANIVSLKEVFTSRAFGDSSIIFAYDYHPLSETLYEHYLAPQVPVLQANGTYRPRFNQVDDRTLWSYIVQITGAIKIVHSAGMAMRTINISKVLITGKKRLRINCCGVLDVLRFEKDVPIAVQQEADIEDLGKLILMLACNSVSAVNNIGRSIEQLSRSFSADVRTVLFYALGPLLNNNSNSNNNQPSSTNEPRTVDRLVEMVSKRIFDQMNVSLYYNDMLENELMRELENGRIVRILCKFGFVNERPEFDHDPRWSEAGDRYVIKLLRDYIFHQVDDQGGAVVDLSHVLSCLNKLDAGTEERVTLVSRDSQTCVVASYRELRNALESAYQELTRQT